MRKKIARSRELLARDFAGLRYELDFPRKIRKAFQRNTVAWVGTALAAGLFLALLRARPKKVYIGGGKKARSPNKTLLESGLLLSAVKLGITVLQPMVLSYFKKRARRAGDSAGRFSAW
ncbi:MAG: hypothetical protein ACREIF_08230 [Chthoniobacterales bacterium]